VPFPIAEAATRKNTRLCVLQPAYVGHSV